MSLVDIPTIPDVAVLALSNGTVSPDLVAGALGGPRDDVLQQFWTSLPGVLADQLNGRRVGDGMNLHHVTVELAPIESATRTVERTPEGDLAIHVVTGRHVVTAKVTTPTIFGAWADPEFSLDFGLEFTYVVDIPPVAAPLSVTGFHDLRITLPHADSQNLTGDIALFFVGLVEFFSDFDLDTLIADKLGELDLAGSANERLAGVNRSVTDLAGRGFHYLELMVGDAADLARQLGVPVPGLPAGQTMLALVCRQPDTSGVVEGEVSWRERAGGPVDRLKARLIGDIARARLGAASGTAARELVEAGGDTSIAAARSLAAHLVTATNATSVADLVTRPAASNIVADALGSEALRAWDAGAGPGPAIAPTQVIRDVDSSVYEALIGGREAYESVTDVFRRGPAQFAITCTVPDGGGSHPTGRLVGTWYDDGDGWSRRRFRIEDVETDVPITVTCALDPGFVWRPESEVTCAPRHWSGTVTVHPPLSFADQLDHGTLQVTALLGGGERRTVALSALTADAAGTRRSLVVEGTPADEVTLNPQPLPPRWAGVLEPGSDRAIIIIAGRDGDDASLNPQPLPPRWRALSRRGDHGTTVVDISSVFEKIAAVRVPKDEPVEAHVRVLRGPRVLRGQGNQEPPFLGPLRRTEVDRPVDLSGEARRVAREAAPALVSRVDRWGDLEVMDVDPDLFLPDVVDPTGHGTVRGIDFRVTRD